MHSETDRHMHSETDRQADSDRETDKQRQKGKRREGEVAHFHQKQKQNKKILV